MNTAALLVQYAFIDCCGEYAAIDDDVDDVAAGAAVDESAAE